MVWNMHFIMYRSEWVYVLKKHIMKKILNSLLMIVFLICLGAFVSSCGHGDDADPYEAGLDGGMDWDALDEGPSEYSSVGELAEATIKGLAEDIVFTTFDIVQSMNLDVGRVEENNSKYLSYSSIDYQSISLSVEDTNGGTAYIQGTGTFVKNQPQRCALFANLINDYSSYSYLDKASSYVEEATMLGNGEIRSIATSRGCNFLTDMNLDIKMKSSISVNGITVRTLDFKADYQSMLSPTITVTSAMVSTAEGTYYCRTFNSGGIFCTTIDHSIHDFEDMSSCTDSGESVRRECDLDMDSYFEAEWMFGSRAVPYEVHLKCSDSGIWTPPCRLNDNVDACPYDSVCRASDDADWGPGLEGYGYCSCN